MRGFRQRRHVPPAIVVMLVALWIDVASPALAHDPEPPDRPSTGTTTSPPTVEPSGKTHSVWPWVLIGAGALTIGAGIWLVSSDHHDVAGMCVTSPTQRTTCPYATSTAWQGWTAVIIGAQLLAAGIGWRVFEARRGDKSVSLTMSPGGLGFAGTF